MEEIVRQVLSILRGMWKYRWPAVLTAWVAAVVGVVVVFKIPTSTRPRRASTSTRSPSSSR
jgi:uncharacterized integral membrane protein